MCVNLRFAWNFIYDKVFPSILDAERELILSRIIRKIKKDNNTLVGGFRWEIFDCHND